MTFFSLSLLRSREILRVSRDILCRRLYFCNLAMIGSFTRACGPRFCNCLMDVLCNLIKLLYFVVLTVDRQHIRSPYCILVVDVILVLLDFHFLFSIGLFKMLYLNYKTIFLATCFSEMFGGYPVYLLLCCDAENDSIHDSYIIGVLGWPPLISNTGLSQGLTPL